jgi:hypothetical protein
MPTINQLPLLARVSPGDQFVLYTPNNGDARRLPVSELLTFFQSSFASPTIAVNLFVPGNGFNITVPTPVAEQQWMLLQPAGTLATGTITLPLNTGVPDGTELLITSTQTITALTIALNGASAIYGDVSTLTAGAAVRYRFYQPTNSWYNIANETAGFSAAIQAFLNNPTSANLSAAVTDETGSGPLVFADFPTFLQPNIGVATATSLETGPVFGTIQSLVGPGAVNLTTYTTEFMSTGTGDALTLADGVDGQIKNIVYVAETAGGDTGVLTPANLGAYTTITFNAPGDSVQLQFMSAQWWVISAFGAVVA